MPTVAEEKRQLRAEVRTAERELPLEYKRSSNIEIIRHVMNLPDYQKARCVFCFVGTKREIDTMPLLEDILAQGKRLCVPLCVGEGVMQLREICFLNQLVPGAYGILEPVAETPLVHPDEVELSIIPCVSCNHFGERLGQGGGFYDRFFANGTEHTVLLCREKLMRPHIPKEALDLCFPLVVTEQGIYFQGKTMAL